MPASSALMSGTMPASAFSLRPSPVRRILSNMPMRPASLPVGSPADRPLSRPAGSGGSPARPLLDVEQLLADRVHDRFHPRVQVELLEDVPHVVLHGVL